MANDARIPAGLSLDALKPGDVLLYSRRSFFNWIIRVKTWSRFTHVEMLIREDGGSLVALASRNGKGVGRYAVDFSDVALVLRPIVPCVAGNCVDLAAGEAWFDLVADGQGYDWMGLLNFTYARVASRDNGAMFCSEFVTRLLRACRFDPFSGADADTVAPRDFSLAPVFSTVWRSADEQALFDKGIV